MVCTLHLVPCQVQSKESALSYSGSYAQYVSNFPPACFSSVSVNYYMTPPPPPLPLAFSFYKNVDNTWISFQSIFVLLRLVQLSE